jgi:hypothetical protein
MKLLTLKLEIADAIRDTDLKIAKLEVSLKDYAVSRIKAMKHELKLTDDEVIEETRDAVGNLRKRHTLNGWFREAGISQRGERSDKGEERKSQEEKHAEALQKAIDGGDLTKESEARFKNAIKALLAPAPSK